MLNMVEGYTGTRAETCPWQAFTVPIVVDTIAAYPFFESGQLAVAIGADPPNVLVEALGVYHTALMRTHAKQLDARRSQSEHAQKHSEAVSQMRGMYGRRG